MGPSVPTSLERNAETTAIIASIDIKPICRKRCSLGMRMSRHTAQQTSISTPYTMPTSHHLTTSPTTIPSIQPAEHGEHPLSTHRATGGRPIFQPCADIVPCQTTILLNLPPYGFPVVALHNIQRRIYRAQQRQTARSGLFGKRRVPSRHIHVQRPGHVDRGCHLLVMERATVPVHLCR